MTRLETWRWAIRAFRKEILEFRFDYPIEEVLLAGPKRSLQYYIFSERLFLDAMRLDGNGIPLHCSRTFVSYNPAYIAWYGLVHLERSIRQDDAAGRDVFLKQVQWLVDNAVRREDGSIVWPLTFDWREGDCLFRAPWISAMIQGLAISALVRAHRIIGDGHVLDLCRGATRVFEKDVQDGGVRTFEVGHAVYEEYPGFPLPRVLDGYLFSLLGLYDFVAETQDSNARELLSDGINGLKYLLPFWDYRGRWSRYGAHGYLCPPHYHRLNGALLASLARLTGDGLLDRYATSWASDRLGAAAKAEIFLTFLLTKNWCRIRHFRRRQ
jgi:D-glucuronyl C5-epimerase-like protein